MNGTEPLSRRGRVHTSRVSAKARLTLSARVVSVMALAVAIAPAPSAAASWNALPVMAAAYDALPVMAPAYDARPVSAPALQSETQDSIRAEQAEPGSNLRVFLMTIGQGEAVWEKFGHNAIWIRDNSGEIDVAYNYGMFSFEESGYVRKLLVGRMDYWMQGFEGTALANYYVSENRSVWIQELNLRPGQRAELLRFLAWNALEENRFYRYDYYRDNCSTRVRDALNRVMGGELQDQLEGVLTGETYRSHTQRLTADLIPTSTGLLLAEGHPVDVPLSAWEESFIPMELMKHVRNVTVPGPFGPEPLVLSATDLFTADRSPEWTSAPDRRIPYTLAGVLLGALLLGLARLGRRNRVARAGFWMGATLWALAVGVFGTMITLLWTLTDHVITYRNENVLQAGPLSLLLAGFLVAAAFGHGRRTARVLAFIVAALAAAGFILQVLPGMDQPNGEIIGMLLPVHVALAAALGWLAPGRGTQGAGA